jgi:hypothetical protein
VLLPAIQLIEEAKRKMILFSCNLVERLRYDFLGDELRLD